MVYSNPMDEPRESLSELLDAILKQLRYNEERLRGVDPLYEDIQ